MANQGKHWTKGTAGRIALPSRNCSFQTLKIPVTVLTPTQSITESVKQETLRDFGRRGDVTVAMSLQSATFNDEIAFKLSAVNNSKLEFYSVSVALVRLILLYFVSEQFGFQVKDTRFVAQKTVYEVRKAIKMCHYPGAIEQHQNDFYWQDKIQVWIKFCWFHPIQIWTIWFQLNPNDVTPTTRVEGTLANFTPIWNYGIIFRNDRILLLFGGHNFAWQIIAASWTFSTSRAYYAFWIIKCKLFELELYFCSCKCILALALHHRKWAFTDGNSSLKWRMMSLNRHNRLTVHL